jgi:hypothetical protein
MDFPFKLTIEKRPGYLYAHFEGDPVTLSNIIDTVNGVAGAISEGQYDRLLLVRNSPLLQSDENRQLLNAMVKARLPEGVKCALVDIYGNDAAAIARAIEASRSVGWDLTAFESIEAAEEWLTNKQKPML